MKKHDQRLVPRFKVTDNGAVLVSPNLIVSHSLLDVSVNGLAFSYSVNFGYENWSGEKRAIDLFGEDFIIVDVPVRIISDRPFDYLEISESFNVNTPHLRRCGVQFSTLNPKQKKQLGAYVESLDILSTQEN